MWLQQATQPMPECTTADRAIPGGVQLGQLPQAPHFGGALQSEAEEQQCGAGWSSGSPSSGALNPPAADAIATAACSSFFSSGAVGSEWGRGPAP